MKAKRIIRQIFFTLFAILAFFIIAECFIRLGFLIYRYYIYRNVPNYPSLAFDAQRAWKWKDQPLFRGRKYVPKEHPANIFRIITMGDSCVWGGGLEANQTFSFYLEKILNEAGYDLKFEVLNAGIPGYNSRQVYLFLKDELIDYHPDLVVVRANPYDFRGADEADLVPPPNDKASAIQFLQHTLFKSKLYYVLRKSLIRIRERRTFPDKRWHSSLTYLAKIRNLLDERGIQMLIVQPVSKRNNALDIDTTTSARRWEAPLVRVYDAYIKSQHSPDELLLDEVHPSELGHRIIAEEIYKVMLENDMIKKKVQANIER